ncbi:hypothetical protein B0I35DRAFT_253441 [Stachybotrys elegans]|uniref:Uncharacterized protein n=1 Tax=Stachybotrys elegans TaxID=80388 RepID=A0A8K0SLV7_9HYPO|nr:hypothetical protein B0I35DRAFT_253441 [Stachybotrys elegans]
MEGWALAGVAIVLVTEWSLLHLNLLWRGMRTDVSKRDGPYRNTLAGSSKLSGRLSMDWTKATWEASTPAYRTAAASWLDALTIPSALCFCIAIMVLSTARREVEILASTKPPTSRGHGCLRVLLTWPSSLGLI